MRVLLFGGQGMLGRDIALQLSDEDLTTPTEDQLDIRDSAKLLAEVRRVRPDVVVSTVAFHRVDEAESEVAKAFELNAVATRNLAFAAGEVGARLAWISTDYVFDGHSSQPYETDAAVNPLCVYGVSKAAGEQVIRMTTDRHLIVRTCGLYGLHRPAVRRANFVDTMLKLAASGRRRVSVVSDQVCAPTYTADFAEAFAALLRSGATGTFHITSAGACAWADFAEEIFRLTGHVVEVERISSAQYGAAARRPAYSVLSLRKTVAAGVPEPREWREALRAFLQQRMAGSQ